MPAADLPPSYPILEYDAAPEAVIEPKQQIAPEDVPTHAVICFFQGVISRLAQEHGAKVIKHLRSEIGTHPIYELEVSGKRLAVFQPGVGAPLAASLLEETIALGCRDFIACGGAGVLRREIAVGHIVIPTSAVRDEGTSYHYLPPSREVAPHPEALAAIETVLRAHNIEYVTGKTWTTDAIFRETPGKVARRRDEGCLTVEMEAAAFFAVAQFRGIRLAKMLYGGDDVSSEAWDSRHWASHDVREQLFWLAAEACLSLE